MNLSDRLREAMADAGINQRDLAQRCDVKPPSVNGWLSGKAKFLRGENLLRAASVLNVSDQWLATGKLPKERGAAMRQQSQSVRVDQDMIDETLWAFNQFYEETGRKFSIDAEPARFLQAYLERVKLPEVSTPEGKVTFIVRVAKIASPQGGGVDEPSDGVPDAGTLKKHVAGGGRRKKAS